MVLLAKHLPQRLKTCSMFGQVRSRPDEVASKRAAMSMRVSGFKFKSMVALVFSCSRSVVSRRKASSGMTFMKSMEEVVSLV